jgi:hypothetical protein
VLRALRAWPLPIVVPPRLPKVGQRAKQVVWNQLLTPLRAEVIDELRWYFGQARTHATPSRCNDLDERFYQAREAFSAPRFKALCWMWKQDGDRVLADAGSRALDEAVFAGAGRVETLELGHRYGRLSLSLSQRRLRPCPEPRAPKRSVVQALRDLAEAKVNSTVGSRLYRVSA